MTENQSVLNTIEEAITSIKKGEVVIVVDDESRENEGDFIGAADKVTPEMINFMATHGKGLICAPITEMRCNELHLDLMVGMNTDPLGTAFTVSVDYDGKGVTTGISAYDRAVTIKALTDPETKSHQLRRPGHVFPLRACEGGVLRRTGHTEAAIDLARLAGLSPAGVIIEIMNEDGTMARLPELVKIALKFNLKIISIEDLVAYRMQNESLINKVDAFPIKTRFGEFQLHAYQQTTNNKVHIALTKGSWKNEEEVLVRVNSSKAHDDMLESLFHNFDEKTIQLFNKINTAGKGAVLFINQENSYIDLILRLKKIKDTQKNNENTLPQQPMDNKDLGIGAQIIHQLGISKLKVLSNSQTVTKKVGMTGYGLEIVAYESY